MIKRTEREKRGSNLIGQTEKKGILYTKEKTFNNHHFFATKTRVQIFGQKIATFLSLHLALFDTTVHFIFENLFNSFFSKANLFNSK